MTSFYYTFMLHNRDYFSHWEFIASASLGMPRAMLFVCFTRRMEMSLPVLYSSACLFAPHHHFTQSSQLNMPVLIVSQHYTRVTSLKCHTSMVSFSIIYMFLSSFSPNSNATVYYAYRPVRLSALSLRMNTGSAPISQLNGHWFDERNMLARQALRI